MSESNALTPAATRSPAAMAPEEIAAEVAALAEHLHRSGVQFVPIANPQAVESIAESLMPPSVRIVETTPRPESTPPPAPQTARPANTPAARRPPSPPLIPVDEVQEEYRGAPLPMDQRVRELESLAGQVAACVQCTELVRCRTQTVFGEGSPTPRFAFFGEGPGVEEDRSGRPFVGKAGQLLTKMIEACSLRREDVYILNTVKCRPPNNRNPEPEEVEHCREYFEQQLSILRPEYIVCLGAVSSRALLRSKLSVGRLRGRLHRYLESKVLVTYHPAYLLRTPAAKKAAWEDLQLMLRDAGIDRTARR